MNPILSMMTQNKVSEMAQQFKGMMNYPQQMVQQMLSGNPNYKQAMDVVNQYGGDGQKAFYETANKLGIDPNMVLGMLK